MKLYDILSMIDDPSEQYYSPVIGWCHAIPNQDGGIDLWQANKDKKSRQHIWVDSDGKLFPDGMCIVWPDEYLNLSDEWERYIGTYLAR